MNSYESIPEFYAGKSVFITGGTGFVGKVLIEKLLYSCPKIDKVFILVKEKKNISPEKRMKTIFNLPMFTRLKKVRPNDINKVVPIVGDLGLPNLGIQGEDEQMLIKKVSVVFHVAATVRFDEPLKVAMNINYEGTRRIFDLSQRMEKLQVFVHVSTAYSNCEHKVIEEIIYPNPFTSEDVYTAIKLQENDRNDTMIKEILAKHPNTYTFTKALTENLIAEYRGKVPVVIVRPSIIVASKEEPLKGWVDNWYGATGIMTMIAMGFNKVMYGDPSSVIDLVPVDHVSNLIIVAAARFDRSDELTIYNCCTSTTNPVTIGQVCDTFFVEGVKSKINKFPYLTIIYTRSWWFLWTIILSLNLIPAFIADCFLRLIWKKPRFFAVQKKVKNLHLTVRYFTINHWFMRTRNTQALFMSLSASDRQQFSFDIFDIDWMTFIPDYFMGIRKYLM